MYQSAELPDNLEEVIVKSILASAKQYDNTKGKLSLNFK